ncbi:hypothetical protein FRACYDRAFT_218483 [Fragilariopsis cylindrus CCMP1102]|uniref:WW domain-containing protein n=1 Tax=Fragilariopsis cylindrus CCMP1102 TaxID=635003 RepID=A0A1E7FCZ0_9STRA|nr:hypothetical protein FRACYDRAFT_218483 [Fragilariopsis cylindrus CCMP1102]|eukprot:OEU15935.1 hypothetical protein FRACYDRAFT_218483 [Fragilariopsis cylindrus CCMP1102]
MRQFNLAIARSYTTTLLLVVLAWCCFCGGGNHAMAFHQSKVPIIIPTEIPSTSSTSSSSLSNSPLRPVVSDDNFAAVARTAVGAATLAVLLTVGTPFLAAPAFAASTGSSTAAQIFVDQIPPTTISIEINDLPIAYKYMTDGESNAPSVVIKSPKDKVKAIKEAAGGHIEVDIAGKAGLKTHLDVDVAADEAGVARVRIASDLIPPLPFKNLASSSSSLNGGKESIWQSVTNMGSGESYYFNTKTGLTQFEKPDKI